MRIGSLSLGFIRRFLMVCPPFKCTSILYFLQVLLKLSLSPWWYGTFMCDLCSWLLLMFGLHQRTTMAVKHIHWLLEFCLTNTYFLFQGRLYEQKEGVAMGFPISPIVANIFMEDFENRALATSPCTPKIWKRFVDDAFTVIKKNQKQTFLNHLNSINNNIQFTSEDPGEDGSIPFLDMLVIPDGEGRLKTTVYRKPTHTNQYLHWDSHHAIPSKYSMIGTLFHRAKPICSEPKHLQDEEEHPYRTLKKCKYPTWALNRVKLRIQTTPPRRKRTIETSITTKNMSHT